MGSAGATEQAWQGPAGSDAGSDLDHWLKWAWDHMLLHNGQGMHNRAGFEALVFGHLSAAEPVRHYLQDNHVQNC